MLRIDVDTNQLNRFIKMLGDTIDEYAPQRQRDMIETLTKEIVGEMEYPPESEANQPPPPYYARGRGTISAGGQITYRSGNLSEKWERSVSISGNEVEGNIRNEATGVHIGGGGIRIYPSYVHGIPNHPSDLLRQAWFHRDRNWPSAFLVAQAAAGEDVAVSVRADFSDSPEKTAEDILAQLEK